MKILSLILFMTTHSFASGDFSVSVVRGTDKEWIRVVPKGKLWECGSNLVPMTETPGYPLKNVNWPALEKEAKVMPKNCDQTVKFVDDLKGQDKIVTTCLSQPATKAAYETLSGNCKSDI